MQGLLSLLKHLQGQHEQKLHAGKGGGAMKHAPVKPGVDFRSKGIRDSRKLTASYMKCCESNPMENSSSVINKISKRSGIPKEDVDEFMSIWNTGIHNNTPVDVAHIFKAISEEMGVKMSKFENEQKKAVSTAEIDPKRLSKYKKISRAIYDETQEEFKSRGMTEIPLYRGTVLPKGQMKIGGTFSVATDKHRMNSSESWTTSNDTAELFATSWDKSNYDGVVMSATFPTSKIFSTPMTGIGVSSEFEFIALGGDAVTVETDRGPSS